jgi:tetratricopeptide (TPR) repeat protein
MGFLFLLLIGLGAFALMWRFGLPRAVWSAAGAALMLGAAGYAWQGRPFQPGRPTAPNNRPYPLDPAEIELRDRLWGRFTSDAAYLTASDAMLRAGDAGSAAAVTLGGIRAIPRSAELWTGLGMNLAAHDGDQVSPPAAFAFQQAMRLAPQHPAPRFFAGLAYVKAGKFAEARPYWRRALALTPANYSYRGEIAQRLALLERYLAMQGGAAGVTQ